MKFSGYFIVIAIAILFALVQQSDADILDLIENGINTIETAFRKQRARDTIAIIEQGAKENEDDNIFPEATRLLRDNFINGTNLVSNGEDIIMKGIAETKELIPKDPQAAKTRIQKAVSDGVGSILVKSGIFFKTFGEVLALSNPGAGLKLREASVNIQEHGLLTMNSMNNAASFFVQGVDALGEAAEELLNSLEANAESNFADFYYTIQKTFRRSNQGLRDAQSNPEQVEVENPNCNAFSEDNQGSDAEEEINEAAQSALKRGADADLVKNLNESAKCAIGDLVGIGNDVKNIIEIVGKIVKIDPSAATTSFFRHIENIKKRVHEVVANVFITLSANALKSGKLSNEQIEEVTGAVETGKIQMFSAIQSTGDIITTLEKYIDDAQDLALDSASKSALYGQLALMQGFVSAFKEFLSLL